MALIPVACPPSEPRALARARHQEGPDAKRPRSLSDKQQDLRPDFPLADFLGLRGQPDRLKARSLRRRQCCQSSDLRAALVELGLQDRHTCADSLAARQHGSLGQVSPDAVNRPCVEPQRLQADLCLANASGRCHQVQLDPERSQLLAIGRTGLCRLGLCVLRQRVQLACLDVHQVGLRAKLLRAADEHVAHPVLHGRLAVLDAEPGEADKHNGAHGLAPAGLAKDDQGERSNQRNLGPDRKAREGPAFSGDPRAGAVRDSKEYRDQPDADAKDPLEQAAFIVNGLETKRERHQPPPRESISYSANATPIVPTPITPQIDARTRASSRRSRSSRCASSSTRAVTCSSVYLFAA